MTYFTDRDMQGSCNLRDEMQGYVGKTTTGKSHHFTAEVYASKQHEELSERRWQALQRGDTQLADELWPAFIEYEIETHRKRTQSRIDGAIDAC